MYVEVAVVRRPMSSSNKCNFFIFHSIPFRESSLWEGGTTGDGLLSGPALTSILDLPPETTQRRFQYLFHVVDWLPTLADWIGILPRNATALDGISQANALRYNTPAREELFGGYAQCWPRNDDPREHHYWWGPSLRVRNWKIIQGQSAGPDETNPFPMGDVSIQPPGESLQQQYLLFDLIKDPQEENNVADLYPDILKDMIYKLKLYRQSFVYPQRNDDSDCHFTGLVNTTVGPTW
jgi:arylsulfatase A-like enzyme